MYLTEYADLLAASVKQMKNWRHYYKVSVVLIPDIWIKPNMASLAWFHFQQIR